VKFKASATINGVKNTVSGGIFIL